MAKLMKKKIVAVWIVIMILCSVSFVMAGGDKEAGGETDTANDIVIQHWYHQYGEEGTYEAVQRYAKEYSDKTPGVTVEINWVPGDYFAALNAALLTADGPDVFELQTSDIARVKAGQLEPLNNLFEGGILEDFNATALSRVTVDGIIYGVPMIIDPQLIYYRKSALKKAGIEPPKTMDELIAASAALDSGRVKGLFLGNDLGSASYLLYMTTAASGTNLLDGDKVSFNTANNIKMWQKKQQLAQSGNLLVGAPTEWWDPSALIDGLTEMQYIGLWATPAMVEALGDDLGVMAWPAVDDSAQPSVFIGGWSQSVNANSKQKQASIDYVNSLWIENTNVQQDWNLGYGFHIPPRKSAAASAQALQGSPAVEVLELVDMYGDTPSVLWTGAMDSAYIDAHSQVLLNDADPSEMLKKAEIAVQSELDSLLK